MADYYPLIVRAVEGLERNTGENRRVLYDRARSALVTQLRGADPPLEESDVTRERLALEDAIRRIETEASKRNRDGQNGDEAKAAPPPSLTDQALKGFRDNVAEAEGLGDAAAQANKSARAYSDAMPGVPQLSATPVEPSSSPGADAAEPVALDNNNDEAALPKDDTLTDRPDPALEPAPSAGERAPRQVYPPPGAELEGEGAGVYRQPPRSYRGLVATLIVLLLLGGIAAAGYWQRAALLPLGTKAMGLIASLRTPSPATPQPPREQTPAQPKITDRVGQPDQQPPGAAPANAPTADVAQKVVLYEEEPNNPEGKRYVGSAIWRTETVSPGPGLAPELAVRADIDIPERHMRLSWSLRRNTDKALPASHTIEIMFTLPADFSEGGVQNVPGVLMKQNEQARGVPLAGLTVKVTNGFFLIGLSSVDIDLQRNIGLLKERPWFDIPIVYNNNKRAILAVEKGIPGERAFADAFRTWNQ